MKLVILLITAIILSVFPYSTMAVNDGVKYELVRIFSADAQNGNIRAEVLFELPYPDVNLIDADKLYNIESTGVFEVFNVSDNCLISIDSARRTLSDVKSETFMLITVKDNTVTYMKNVSSVLFQEGGIYSGILEENNPDLGYITLYFPDGSGTSPNLKNALSYYRTFSYLRAENVTVYKNGKLADIESINPGDSVFIKTSSEGYIEKISAADNFYPVYGRVMSKGKWILQIKKEDGSVIQLRIPSDTPIFENKMTSSWDDIDEGDEVRILLQTSGNQTIIGEITVENEEIEIEAVYKANLVYYDKFTNSIAVSNVQQFKDGIWNISGVSGIRKLPVSDSYTPDIPKGAYGTVYIASGKSITGNEAVVRLLMDKSSLRTQVSGDTIVSADPGRGKLTLMNKSKTVSYDDTSLIIKNGKLLSKNQVKSNDEAYFVTSSQADGTIKANIIWIREPLKDTGLTLIRGRISQIDLYNSMTLESFSEFDEPSWEFKNVKKTLTIDPSVTRVFDDGGRLGLSAFDDTGENSFRKRTVYVLAQEGQALLVSTAPFGDVVYKGRISELNGVQKDSFSHIVVPATSMVVKDGMRYNDKTAKWENVPEVQFSFIPNTVFVKNGKIIDASQLSEGDRITVIKSELGDNAFVVLAESF